MLQTADIPSYLNRPAPADYTYGTLRYDERTDSWIIEGEPIVCQMAKRLFPGAEGRGKGIARFKSNKRTNGELNWLMMRYPLKIENPDKWERDYQQAVDHAVKRQQLLKSPQKLEPSSLYFNGKLAEFQKEGVAFLLHNAPTLLADDMGLGKTVQALGWIASLERFPGLIVAPTSVQTQWKQQIIKFMQPQPVADSLLPEMNVHIIRGLKPYSLPPAQFYIIHYGLLRGWKQYLPSFGFEFVVFDEIQELRHSGTEKYSAASLLAQSTEKVIGLSGTPIYGKGGEMWNVMNILDFQCLGDWESFTREWCDGYGSDVVADPEMLGDHLRREGLMLRRSKDDVLTELPPKRRIVQQIDSDEHVFLKEMRTVIRLIGKHDQAENHFEKGRIKREIGQRVRQATGVAKAPYVAEFVKMLLDAGEPVILYGYHHEVYAQWEERLRGYRPAFITGRETPAEKEAAKRRFIEGETNLLIISLRAAAGLDGLQERANINVFGELDWSPGIHSQCEDRTHRMGQKDSVISYYLVCGEGSDEQMMEALGFKTAQFVGIMGESAESEEDREISQIEVGKHLDKVMEKLRKAEERRRTSGQ
ncbi:DEAD/DEAH box helicase [Cohnella massiliensis]|uniref:DEAD/DEAH box helicase n=1 Tax=Cohnella massiliensis TaxID=1816691 RepID=UPI0009BB712A|nr:DEAD/DEAH box helicase [Cohnella massiliensis]